MPEEPKIIYTLGVGDKTQSKYLSAERVKIVATINRIRFS
jgi:hypothetical protein